MRVLGRAFAHNRSVKELVLQQAEAAGGRDEELRERFMGFVFPTGE